MALADFKRLEPLKGYTANGRNFGLYPSFGDVSVKADFAYTQATKDFSMQLRAQSATRTTDSSGNSGVTISSNIYVASGYDGIFDIKPPKALFMGTWLTTDEHYSSSVEGCDVTYSVKNGIYWRTKNGYGTQLSKNFNSVAPFLDVPLNDCFYFLNGSTTSGAWRGTTFARDSEGKLRYGDGSSSTQYFYLLTLLNRDESVLNSSVCDEIPTNGVSLYWFSRDDNKWHSYYRPYFGTFLNWESTDGRVQAIVRLCDPPIQINSSLTGERSGVNVLSVPRADGTGVIPLRPYFPDGFYPIGLYENDFAMMEVTSTSTKYYLKMSFIRKMLAYSGMRFMGHYSNNPQFQPSSSSTGTGFTYKKAGTSYVNPFYPENFTECEYSFIGEMNEKSRTTGRIIPYSELSSHLDMPNMKDGFNPENSGYKDDSEDSDSDDIDDMKLGYGRSYLGMVKYYKLTPAQLVSFGQDISDESLIEAGFDAFKSIVSLKMYTLPINTYGEFTEPEQVYLSYQPLTISAERLSSTKTHIHLGDYTIEGYHGSITNPHFLDMEPYTNVEVYIPFCGFVNLPTTKVMYQTIEVYLVFDVVLATCSGVVKCNGNIIAEKSGVIGSDIPFAAENAGIMNGAIMESALSTAGSAALTAASGITGNAFGAMSGIIAGVASISHGVTSVYKNYTQVVGTAGGEVPFGLPDSCFIKITYPKKFLPDDYNSMVGRMCNKTGKLGDFSGFTVCENCHVNIKATNVEREMLEKLLKKGVILP